MIPARLSDIKLAPENAVYYRPITLLSVSDLIASMHKVGVLEPLVVSSDHYLISGHRRLKAALASNVKTVQVRELPISYEHDHEKFCELLIHFNTQRNKSDDEKLNEIMAKLDPVTTHKMLKESRNLNAQRAGNYLSRINCEDIIERRELTDAKMPLLNAVLRILKENKEFWPLTVRQIHYRLLGPHAPLTHASKPDSRYLNDYNSYQKAIDVCTRGRLSGHYVGSARR
jgi:ParB-like chromosome segregation protein Spo0J